MEVVHKRTRQIKSLIKYFFKQYLNIFLFILLQSVNFGEDQELSCVISLNLTDLQNNCTSTFFQNYEIFSNFNLNENIYFGRYGNANPLYIQVKRILFSITGKIIFFCKGLGCNVNKLSKLR